MRQRTTIVLRRVVTPIALTSLLAGGLSLAASAAASSPDDTSTGSAAGSAAPAAIDAERCEANRAAGTITYLTGFDYAAAASMVEVYVAADRGYYDELCLDVEVRPSFSTANYPLIAAGEAQFASAGSFSEVLEYGQINETELVAVTIDGRSPIDVLILKPGTADELADLAGATIGIKGKLQPSVAAMLATADLADGEDYTTVLLDGFDPVAHIALDGIDGFPGYRSNEPGALERADVDFDLFDPADYDIPGSFGVTYTSRRFIEDHPTAAQDFVRASLRGLADAVADPEAAVGVAMALVTDGGNPNYLSEEGETFRWTTDAATIAGSATPEAPLGVPVPELLQAEVDAYHDVGLFPDGAPAITDALSLDLTDALYDDTGTLIWP
ncbi:ABC transporter substrate-binding protein [Desertimonas flava]|uniref:ABC transporter substrate-binding protein n=1 Tax=Desertimonas flava TaxID=2064846 RepID=UPI000E34A8C2|nr:ABC transporter substrate-binding protein [Desertimonas flava]